MECCVKLTSCKLIPFGDQKQKFLPQCNILLPSPTELRWDRELCVGRAWEWPWTVPEPGSGQGPFLLFIICYLLFIGLLHTVWNENSQVCYLWTYGSARCPGLSITQIPALFQVLIPSISLLTNRKTPAQGRAGL